MAAAEKEGRGCFFYGCITSIVVTIIVVIAAVLGVRYAINTAVDVVIEYTDATPVSLPPTFASPAEVSSLQARVDTFKAGLGQAGEPRELVLSGQDINVLIKEHPELEQIRGMAHVSIVGDQIGAEVSVPLDILQIERLKGRYLNGSAALSGSLQGGHLDIRLQGLTVKGQPLPDEVMSQLTGQNLAEQAQTDPDVAAMIRQLEEIRVEGGKLILRKK